MLLRKLSQIRIFSTKIKYISISLTLESNGHLLTWEMKSQEWRMKNHHIWQVQSSKLKFRFMTVCNFQSMKSLMELHSLLSKFFWFIKILLIYHLVVISPDRRDIGQLTKEAFYVKYCCFFETIVLRFKNYKLMSYWDWFGLTRFPYFDGTIRYPKRVN